VAEVAVAAEQVRRAAGRPPSRAGARRSAGAEGLAEALAVGRAAATWWKTIASPCTGWARASGRDATPSAPAAMTGESTLEGPNSPERMPAAPMAAAPSPALAPPPGNPRFPLLDAMRAFAALAIVMTHTAGVTQFNTDNPLGAYTARLNFGVTLFFLLSGSCCTARSSRRG
jgi:peptidoglycan/LPS O-acetylase OafA/YrhL